MNRSDFFTWQSVSVSQSPSHRLRGNEFPPLSPTVTRALKVGDVEECLLGEVEECLLGFLLGLIEGCTLVLVGDRVTSFMVGAPVTCFVGDRVTFGMQ